MILWSIMKNQIIVLQSGIGLLLFSVLFAQTPEILSDPYSAIDYPNEHIECLWFDSLNVSFAGNWPFGPSYAVACDAIRDLAFCGSGGGIYILDVSSPSFPLFLSEGIHTRGIVYGLFYEGSLQRLYIAAGTAGIEIWDVADPQVPAKLGYYDTPGKANSIFVAGSYAYVADMSAGLRVIDISTPSNPQEVGNCATPDDAYAVYIDSIYAYVAG
jgi:hypothetical protein